MNNINKYKDILYTILNDISPISNDIWQEVSKCLKLKTLKKHEHLFYEEDKVNEFYFLISGIARYYYKRDDGKEFNKSFAQNKGHLLSSISSVTSNECSPFSVEVLSDFTTLYISYENYIYFTKYNSWNKLVLTIYEKLIIKKEKREANFLLLDAQQRYEIFLYEYDKIVNIIPNYHIASYLGISEVSLCRIRKEMKLT